LVVFDFYQRPLFAPLGGKKKSYVLPKASDMSVRSDAGIQFEATSLVDQTPGEQAIPTMVSKSVHAAHKSGDGVVTIQGDGMVIIKCECGKTIRRQAKWTHAKVVCPSCLKTIES
jgi:hypothetical protein